MSGCPPQRTMTGYRLASPPPYAKLGYAPYWSPDQDAQACVATAAWMTAILQPSTRRSRDVHCHEPLPGEEGIRTGVREGVAQPRFAAEQGSGLRRIPPAEGTRARRLHALCVAYGLAEPECLRGMDQVGGISCRPQGCRPEQAALYRPSPIRGFRGPADRTSRRNRCRLGFRRAWKSLLAIASVKLLLRPAKLLCGDRFAVDCRGLQGLTPRSRTCAPSPRSRSAATPRGEADAPARYVQARPESNATIPATRAAGAPSLIRSVFARCAEIIGETGADIGYEELVNAHLAFRELLLIKVGHESIQRREAAFDRVVPDLRSEQPARFFHL